MLEKINDLPPHLLGIRASGEVTKEDMDAVLLPGLGELVRRTGAIQYLLVLDNSVQDFTAGAWWSDMIAGLKHFPKWERIAVVTDQVAVEKFTDLFELAVPGRSKGFKHHQLEEAITWISQREAKSFKKSWLIGAGVLALGGLAIWTRAKRKKRHGLAGFKI